MGRGTGRMPSDEVSESRVFDTFCLLLQVSQDMCVADCLKSHIIIKVSKLGERNEFCYIRKSCVEKETGDRAILCLL
jgi:hypothetical protein